MSTDMCVCGGGVYVCGGGGGWKREVGLKFFLFNGGVRSEA